MPPLTIRNDILRAANSARFHLRHYAQGYYPLAGNNGSIQLPVNRLFYTLRNPNGESNFICDEYTHFILKPRRLYFIPAFHPAKVRLDGDLFFLSVQSNLEIFPGTELFSGCSAILEIPDPAELPELERLFASGTDRLISASLKCRELTFSRLLSLMECFPEEDFQQVASLRDYTVLMNFLREQGSAETRVTDLAEVMKESREGFSRHFQKKTGITPKQLIDRFLMGKALDLLGGNAAIKEIAYRLKFSNEFVFSRFFKSHTGEAPKVWRARRIHM